MQIAIITVFILVLVALIVARVRQSPAPAPAGVRAGMAVAKKVPADEAVVRTGSRPPVSPAPSPFRAVSIKAGSGACAAVSALQGERFLIGMVPHIPLADCGAKSCTCKYVHHEDRRHLDDERRVPAGLSTELYTSTGNAERRTRARGRRETD